MEQITLFTWGYWGWGNATRWKPDTSLTLTALKAEARGWLREGGLRPRTA